MKDAWKSILGAATAWPLIYLVCYFLFAFWVFFSTAGAGETPAAVTSAQAVAAVLTALTVALSGALFIVYLVLIIENDRLDAGMKTAWVIVVLAGSIAGMLVYWYLQVRNPSEGQLGVLGLGLGLAADRQSRSAQAFDEGGGEGTHQ